MVPEQTEAIGNTATVIRSISIQHFSQHEEISCAGCNNDIFCSNSLAWKTHYPISVFVPMSVEDGMEIIDDLYII